MSEENFILENSQIDPNELQNILVGFLGQTYGEVAKYDNNLVASNQYLAPKKQEFHRLAEKVLQEANPQSFIKSAATNTRQNSLAIPNNSVQTQFPPRVDSDQMEFNFDNSITAITINNKLDDLEKRLKRMDTIMQNMVSLLENYEIKNKQ